LLALREKLRLRVCENRKLKRIFVPKKEEITGNEKNYITRSLMICTPHSILFGLSYREKHGQGM
jgi:hypothetical protein